MKFIAHRGYSKRHPENTLEAFEAVVNHPLSGQNLIGIELDIHLTADHRIVVMHDMIVNDRHGKVAVADLALDQLRVVHARIKGERFRVPELAEVLELIDHRTELNLEIKTGYYDQQLFMSVLKENLRAYKPCADIVFSSFSADILRYAMEHTSAFDVRYGLLFDSWDAWNAAPDDVRDKLDYVHPRYNLLLKPAQPIDSFGVPVQTWTVDSASLIRKIMRLPGAESIRAIMTNDIALAERFEDK